MTPEELAKKVNDINGDVVTDDSKKCLSVFSAADIQRFIHATHFLTKPAHLEIAKMALQVRIADDQFKSAKILERQTGQLISLTRALVWLTIALLVFTIFLAIRG